jgi:thiol:disulfide interchange protein DsbD
MIARLLLILIFTINFKVIAQVSEPVKWTTKVEQITETQFKLISIANIEPGWYLFSQDTPPNGPIATSFTFDDLNGSVRFIGNTTEEEGVEVIDPELNLKIKQFESSAIFVQNVEILKNNISIDALVEYSVKNGNSTLPLKEVELIFNLNDSEQNLKVISETGDSPKASLKVNSIVPDQIKSGLWKIFFIAFFSGFAALLTPCVFPMIPMTVSFFTKQSKTKLAGIKNALIFGISIIVIYVLLGVLVSLIFGADALNALSTNVWFNLIFFVLLMIFAASFLGAFEIMLPYKWANKADSQANKRGYIGIFFMALALAIVSFSCTGPIVGTLLVQAAAGGNQIGPIVGMLGFSLAVALPFSLFASFPGWLNSLPKSGSWLNTVKVVLGFLELALALKFLSNADLVLQLHLLEREVFIAIWIAIFGSLTFYLFGKIKLPHDSQIPHISVGRLGFGLVVLSFTIYMIPGLWGAPLNLISAFPPPQHYSESPYGVGNARKEVGNTSINQIDLPYGAYLMAPHDIMAFNDYDLGLEFAKKVNKPVMIDFTGHACVNCRKMESNVWVRPNILKILKNDVVLISLYVDDKRPLEGDDVIESKLVPGKKLKYIGQKWSELQTIKYKTNTQPFYVLMNHEEKNLIQPVAYTPNSDVYYNWLLDGISNF